jgi:release factor glutamine methyltransferase
MENNLATVKNLIKLFDRDLKGIYSWEEVRQMLYMLFGEYLGWSKIRVHLSYDEEIDEAALALFTSALADLRTGKPVQYILGKTWFNGSLLTVGPGVLVPRPETEELCALIGTVLHDWQQHEFQILDIGTGSGCIAIDLKKRFPLASVTAIDNSREALDIASKNAREIGCEIKFIQADILNMKDQAGLGRYDVVVSNPPYVTESEKKLMNRNVLEFEPHQALFIADIDPLLFYYVISGFALSHLTRPGHLFFEINERFGHEICNMLLSSGFTDNAVFQDIHGKDRFVSANLKSARAPQR